MRTGLSKWIERGAVLAAAVLLVCTAPGHAQNSKTEPAARPGEPSQSAQLQAALSVCFECHGEGGVSIVPSHPTLAGQKPDYLRRQLLAFKRARQAQGDKGLNAEDQSTGIPARIDPVMEHMANTLTPDLIAPVAAALSSMACDGGKAPRQSARTFELPTAGQACVACHGVDGIGLKPEVPNLAGQQRSYLRRQLLLIRETAWGAQPREGEAWRTHPIMEAQAARLSIADIDAIARYYNALPCGGAAAQPDKPAN